MPVERVVEVEQVRTEYVDEPYEVIVPIRKEVKIPVDRKVIQEVDRILPVNIEVDVYEDVEIVKERIVEVPVNRTVHRPTFQQVEVELPEIQTSTVSHHNRVYREIPTEKIEYTDAPYPQERVVENPVHLDLHVNVEKVVEVPEVEEIIEEKEYKVEKIIEVEKNVEVEKKVYVRKIVEKPTINKIVKRVPREKVVEVFYDKVVSNIIETEEEVEEELDVVLKEVHGVLEVNDVTTNMPLNTRTRTEHISRRQISEFENSSRQVAELQAENQALTHRIEYLDKHIHDPNRIEDARLEQQELRREIQDLSSDLAQKTRERDDLKRKIERNPDNVQLNEIVDDSAAPKLRQDIALVEEKNRALRQFFSAI